MKNLEWKKEKLLQKKQKRDCVSSVSGCVMLLVVVVVIGNLFYNITHTIIYVRWQEDG